MTVLPTVRRQLEQAAERQAATSLRNRAARRSVRRGLPPFSAQGIIAALGAIVALGIAVLAVALLHHAPTARPAAPSPHHPAVRRLLDANGVAGVRFGQRRVAVTPELQRLLGPPHETIPGICGFSATTDWIGLRMNSRDPHVTAQLTLYFEQSRFVGYDYLENRTDALLRPHAFMLATTRGLTLGDTVARARQLYGRAFGETSEPQGTPPSTKLMRLPIGKVRTRRGQIVAGLQGFGHQDRVTAHSMVVSISAGTGPNTPCR